MHNKLASMEFIFRRETSSNYVIPVHCFGKKQTTHKTIMLSWNLGILYSKHFSTIFEGNKIVCETLIFSSFYDGFCMIRYTQGHYIEVAQGGVFCRARHNWWWILSLFWAKKNFKKPTISVYITEILCNFLEWMLQYLKKYILPMKT